jgi:hypothetical protein
LTCSSVSVSEIEPVSATAKSGAHNTDIDIGQGGGFENSRKRTGAFDFGDGRTDHLRLREQREDEPLEVLARSWLGEFAAHAHKRFAKVLKQRCARLLEEWNIAKRRRGRWLLRAHCPDDHFTAAHEGFLLAMYQLRNVCPGASGISR